MVVGRAVSYLGQLLDGGGAELDRNAAKPVWAAGVAASLRELGAGGRHVVLLRDVPRPGFDVPDCLSAHGNATASCTFPRAGHVHPDEALWSAEAPVAAAAGIPDVDMTAAICPGDPCQSGLARRRDRLPRRPPPHRDVRPRGRRLPRRRPRPLPLSRARGQLAGARVAP